MPVVVPGYIECNNVRFWADQIPGTPVTLFLHGFSGDLSAWSLVWDQLPNDFARLRYDLRGFGRTKATKQEPFSHTADALSLANELQLPRFNVVGLSMGAAVALNLALGHADRINKLVLISPGLIGWEWSDRWISQWQKITGAARSGDMAKAKEYWWQHPLFNTTRRSVNAFELYHSIMRYSGQEWLKDYQVMAMPDVDRLCELSVDTLLLTGTKDLDDFRLIASLLDQACAGVQRIDYKGFGHLLNLEAPALIATNIIEFLSE